MTEPVTIERAKLNARIDGDSEDALFAGWITTGRRWVENYTGHILVLRDVTQRFDRFTPGMALHAWPIAPDAAVTIGYTDIAGAAQVVGGYWLGTASRPAILQPAFRTAWPVALDEGRGVFVTVRAGYATPDDVPAEMIAAILLIVKSFHDEREMSESAERAATALCAPYRLWSV